MSAIVIRGGSVNESAEGPSFGARGGLAGLGYARVVDMMQYDPIVRFDAPPVTEVVVAVAFQPLRKLTAAHMGEFWAKALRDDFPHVEERPPYEPPVESYDGPTPAQLSLTLSRQLPQPRLWFKSPNDHELLQVQRDWFACNWRKAAADAKYSHWASRRQSFVQWFEVFSQFLADNNLGSVNATQCEVTYINHISTNDAWSNHGQLHRVFSHIYLAPHFLPEPEEFAFRSKYLIRRDDVVVGRLHVDAQPVVGVKDGRPALSLNLTARGAPLEPGGLDGMLQMLDLGREWIVRGFDALTTPEMHDAWGKQP